MADQDKLSQIFIEQMKIQNALTQSMKDEIHKLATSIHSLATEMRITKQDLTEIGDKLKQLELQNIRQESELQKLEPFIKIGDIFKGLIIKAIAYGAIALVVMYLGSNVEWTKFLPGK